MKWSELTPEQRNRLVYDQIMKPVMCNGPWHIHTLPDGARQICRCTCGYECANELPAQPASHERPVWSLVPYSTDMNAAWEIVEHFAKLPDDPFESRWKKYQFIHDLGMLPCDSPSWYDISYEILASWTPALICLAALKAYGVEIDES